MDRKALAIVLVGLAAASLGASILQRGLAAKPVPPFTATTPKGFFMVIDFSVTPLTSGNVITIVSADAGMTMIGTLHLQIPAAGTGTSIVLDESPTGSPPFFMILRQANFNTAEVDQDISFTGKVLRIGNGSFATANTGILTIEGSAIQFPST